MGGKWQELSLADICDSIDYGYTTSASTAPVGPRFLRITDIVPGFIDWQSVPYCKADAPTAEKFRLHHGDVVVARTGATTGYSAHVANPPDAVFASYLVRLRIGHQADSRFVSYFLKSAGFWDYMRGVLGDKSAQPNASAATMTKVRLMLPPLPEQKAIAAVLGALDDKIELNRQMNATLEAMARALFQSWFVDFDPVRAKLDGRKPDGLDKATTALFPAAFQDPRLGPIPKGWEVRSLDQVANYLNGLALQNYPPSDDVALPVVKIAQLRKGDTEGADKCSADLPPEYIIQDGDVLFSWSGSLEVELWCGGPGALNQHLFKVTSAEFPKWFHYLWTLHHLDEFRLIAAGKATTMGHIQRGHLTAAKVVIPPRPLLDAMTRIVSPLIDQVVANRIQSRTLASLRDSLLPKLLSGDLQVIAHG